ncbi:hypothetical protein B0H13DRAFT_2332436 [Mycena leptocephala]|nr:hypothetical protein B0H13DRAFT_2332436 [Mycena leptocephala]
MLNLVAVYLFSFAPLIPFVAAIPSGPGKAHNQTLVDMSADDVQKIPGWGTLESTAQQNWGSGSYNLVTRMFESSYCGLSFANLDYSVVQIVIDGNPSASGNCITQNTTSSGEQVGTNGTITLQHAAGGTYSTTTTVTPISTIGFPEVADVTAKFSFSTTITNTLSTATTSMTDQTSTESITQTNVAGHTCYLQFTSQTCTITGSAQIQRLGTGWVWFEYNDKTNGHYKWALNMDAVLPNQDDRSSFITFKLLQPPPARLNTTDLHPIHVDLAMHLSFYIRGACL